MTIATWCICDWRKVALVRVDLAEDRIVDASVAEWIGQRANEFIQHAAKASWSIVVIDLGSAEAAA